METDPLNEVRNIRRIISAECDDDPQKVFEYYLKYQDESKRSGKYRLVNTRNVLFTDFDGDGCIDS